MLPVAVELLPHRGIRGVAAAREQHLATAMDLLGAAAHGPHAFDRAGVGPQQRGHRAVEQQIDSAVCTLGLELSREDLEDRAAAIRAPVVAALAVELVAQAHHRMTRHGLESGLHQPVERGTRLVDGKPHDLGIRGPLGNAHDVVEMRVGTVVDAK